MFCAYVDISVFTLIVIHELPLTQLTSGDSSRRPAVRPCMRLCVHTFNMNIYILIALALDESIILNVLQFPMQNIYQSCDLAAPLGGGTSTPANDFVCLLTLVTYRYDVKRRNWAIWLFRISDNF